MPLKWRLESVVFELTDKFTVFKQMTADFPSSGMVSNTAENRKSKGARDVIRRGAVRLWRRGGGRKGVRINIRAERSAAGRIIRGWRQDRTTSRHVEIFVELIDSRTHLWFGIGSIGIGRKIPGVVPIPPEHWQLFHGSTRFLLGCLGRGAANLVKGVDKVASGSVGTEPNTVVCATQICLVFWVAIDSADLLGTMRKLTLLSIFASAVFLEGAAHLGLIAGSLLCWGGNWGAGWCLTLASIQQGTTCSNWAIPIQAR